jgi:hypothetical protein
MKNVYDMKNVKGTRAVALIYKGKFAGKLVANFSNNPNGRVCTALLAIWAGPLKREERKQARAGGYGYDKFGACVEQMLKCGSLGSWETPFRSAGYEVAEVC